jgi:cold shock CspA family protein
MLFLASLNKAVISRQTTFARVGGAAPQQYLSRWLSTASAEDGGDYVYGTVKMYLRKKSYGFIVPDDSEGDADVFVHNSGIAGAVLSNSSAFPFLKTDERVRYTLNQPDPSKQNARPHASNVTYEDGTKIPSYRPEYIVNLAYSEFATLGQAVDAILEDDAIDNKHEAIQEARGKTKATIATSRGRYEHFNEHGTYSAGGDDEQDEEEPTL